MANKAVRYTLASPAKELGSTPWSTSLWAKQDARDAGKGDGGLTSAERISRSGFYAWDQRPMSARARMDLWLTGKIEAIHRRSRGAYGSPMIHAELADARGWVEGSEPAAVRSDDNGRVLAPYRRMGHGNASANGADLGRTGLSLSSQLRAGTSMTLTSKEIPDEDAERSAVTTFRQLVIRIARKRGALWSTHPSASDACGLRLRYSVRSKR